MGFAIKLYSSIPLEEEGVASDRCLLPQEKSLDRPEDLPGRRIPGRNSTAWINPWILHLLLLSVYTSIYFYVQEKLVQRLQHPEELVYTPARQAVELEKKIFHISANDSTAFNGPPSTELDDAWHVLLKNMYLRLSADDLKNLNQTSIMLADGSGDYMGIIDAYHQLHCLQYIRQVVHNDHYTFPPETVTPVEHADHCIESLRQSIMCHPDLSIMTFEWLPNTRGPWPNFENPHQCINWNKIDAWASERAFNFFDPKFLVHPTLGPTFGS